MNTTTQGRCVDAWGEETKNWIGKCLSVGLKEQNVNGQIRGVMRARVFVPVKQSIELRASNEIKEAFSKNRI